MLQNQSSNVPEYFEDYCTMPNGNSVVSVLTHARATHKDWLLFISWQLTLSYQFTTWRTNYFQHGMQFYKPSQASENKIGFVTCSPRLFPNTDILYH